MSIRKSIYLMLVTAGLCSVTAFAESAWVTAASTLLSRVGQWQTDNPQTQGMKVTALRDAASPGIAPPLFKAVLADQLPKSL